MPGTTLVLQLGTNHGSELGIRRESDDTWYYLVSKYPDQEQKLLMPSKDFEAASKVSIPADVIGYVSAYPNGSNQRVFTTDGNYDIYVSSALESEDGGYKCVVQYSQ
jgi:hypothetical protein